MLDTVVYPLVFSATTKTAETMVRSRGCEGMLLLLLSWKTIRERKITGLYCRSDGQCWFGPWFLSYMCIAYPVCPCYNTLTLSKPVSALIRSLSAVCCIPPTPVQCAWESKTLFGNCYYAPLVSCDVRGSGSNWANTAVLNKLSIIYLTSCDISPHLICLNRTPVDRP